MHIRFPLCKINHNELLTYQKIRPNNVWDVDAWNMGAVAVGATVYFGSAESNRQIIEASSI
jgi:class I fructose-bisphosphate aldolase